MSGGVGAVPGPKAVSVLEGHHVGNTLLFPRVLHAQGGLPANGRVHLQSDSVHAVDQKSIHEQLALTTDLGR